MLVFSTDVYKQSFNAELLELFRITQEVHLLFLKLFELYVVVKSESNDANGVRILTEGKSCFLYSKINDFYNFFVNKGH